MFQYMCTFFSENKAPMIRFYLQESSVCNTFIVYVWVLKLYLIYINNEDTADWRIL